MKRIALLALGTLLLGYPAITTASFAQSATEAAQSQTTFYIDNMTCPLCPLTVKAAMGGVKGVRSVEINFAARTASVTFDPARTNPAAIARASEQAGYPAVVRN